MVRLNFDDIQGNILRGVNFSYAVHRFLAFPDAAAGRELLRAMVDRVQSAARWNGEPETLCNLALTFTGLQQLGVDDEILTALPPAFREPMRRRARRVLGDDPDEWEPELGDGRAHVLVLAGTRGEARDPLDAFEAWLDELVERLELEPVYRQAVARLPRQREHFGFADGFGQPAVEGTEQRYPGQGTPEGDRRWRDVKAGEFVLGYPDEDGQRVTGPALGLLRNGSFMVYRKLEQDVPAFRAALAREAKLYCETTLDGAGPEHAAELIAAKLIGRWRDGVAVALEPDRSVGQLAQAAEPKPDNDFRYGEDPHGYRCPVGAHIRRTNPRDTLATRRHRIIRRGMPYGPALPEGETDDAERGLIFICFNADFERQFETIQRHWCDDGDAFGLGRDQDFLFARAGKVTIAGSPPFFVEATPGLVTTRGCEYLLMPGLDALRDLAEPRPGLG